MDESNQRDACEGRRDRGQAVIMVVIVAAVLLVAVIGAIGAMGRTTLARARAQTAADSAALASVAGDVEDARRLAGAHGAILVAWVRGPTPNEVTVTVQLDGETATARASNAVDS
jgi:Flp pilus assembly protein TadG